MKFAIYTIPVALCLVLQQTHGTLWEIDTWNMFQRHVSMEFFDSFKYYTTEEALLGQRRAAVPDVEGIFVWEVEGPNWCGNGWRIYITNTVVPGPYNQTLEVLIKHRSSTSVPIQVMMVDLVGDVTPSQGNRTMVNWYTHLYRTEQGNVGSFIMLSASLCRSDFIIIDKIIVATNETIPTSMY